MNLMILRVTLVIYEVYVRSKKIKEEEKEELKKFNVVRHTMCIPTSTATLGVVCI